MRRATLLQGWAVWAAAGLLVVGLPGRLWRPAQAPDFPWAALPWLVLGFGLLGILSLLLAWRWGPEAGRTRLLAGLEAPPELLWGGLVLAAWPAAWGPPGPGGLLLALLLCLLPGELRWLAQALPREDPFPRIWGERALRMSRAAALRRIAPRWLGARLPLWITATLLLERLLGIRGLGGDWFDRVALRDTGGLLVWLLAFALLWSLAHRLEAVP